METHRIIFRSFDVSGKCRVTAFPSVDGLRMQEHLIPVVDAIGIALSGRPISSRLILSIEETDPFGVEWTGVGDTVAVARLVRADTEAILIVVTDANGSVDAAAMQMLHAQLQGDSASAGLDAAFEWLLGEGTPLAAMAYFRGEPQIGMDTLAMCVGVAFCN